MRVSRFGLSQRPATTREASGAGRRPVLRSLVITCEWEESRVRHSAVAVALPQVHRGPFTYADLESMPDWLGHRFEIIDGVLVVSPSPRPVHQLVVTRLIVLLAPAIPSELFVLTAPLDVVISKTTVVQPDLVVAPRSQFGERNLPGAPLLAVEVLSPTTRRFDLGTKKDAYASAGVAHYWVVDPGEPSITAFALGRGGYRRVALAAGEDRFAVTAPFSVSCVPADLARL